MMRWQSGGMNIPDRPVHFGQHTHHTQNDVRFHVILVDEKCSRCPFAFPQS
jgi:hypothetical protein